MRFVNEGPSLKLTFHRLNESKCTQCKSSNHVQNWQMDSRHKKSQKPNIIAPRPTRIKFDCRRINSKSPVCSSSDFSMEQEDSNNAMENSKDRSWHQWMHRTEACHPRPHWPKDHCFIFTTRLIQPFLSQVITPQASKSRSHLWGFFYLSFV